MPKGRVASVDATRFSMVPRNDVPRSAFDIRHGHKTTFNAGLLIPIYVDEVLPGDSLNLKMNAFCRLSTPLVPMMDNLEFESWFFFVPNRLLWDNWQRFMGERISPTDTTNFLNPYVEILNAGLAPASSLGDYFGLTLNGSGNTLRVNALPFRAYNLVFNEWFLDQAIQARAVVPTGDGPDTASTTYFLLRVNKRHDYFTSARPWPQAMGGAPDQYPATSNVNNQSLNNGFPSFSAGNYRTEGAGVPISGLGVGENVTPLTAAVSVWETGSRKKVYDDTYASTLTPFYMRWSAGNFPDVRVLVNDIRTAVMVQGMLERNARGGTRYTEIVRSHFGVTSPDARLQRPELLGGSRTMIQVNPVAQTSASGIAGTTTKLGELAAIGSGMIYDHGFSQSFTEHGIILGLCTIRSFLTYQQGNNRMWNRRTQYDYYWPGLAHLGEQAILSQEIYADGSTADVNVFGYQERWAEYKYKPSRTSGYFRSTVATPLDMWHLGQKFVARPVLNGSFIEEDPPVSRVLQVATNFGEDFLFDSLFECKWVRAMPMFSIPGVGRTL